MKENAALQQIKPRLPAHPQNNATSIGLIPKEDVAEMRFAQHLSSHLTPEWRKYYIDYEASDLGCVWCSVGADTDPDSHSDSEEDCL